jgi:hypothetical protein
MPRRRPELLTVQMGDERVVYDPVPRQSFRLNRTAGLLLARCDGTTPVASVVAELSAAFAVGPDEVAVQVSRVLGVFDGDGLLVAPAQARPDGLEADLRQIWGRPPPVPADRQSPAPAPFGDSGPASQPENDGAGSIGWRQALDVVVTVSAEDPALVAGLDQVFGCLTPARADHARAAGSTRLHYRLQTSDDRADQIVIELDGQRVGEVASVTAALSFTQWHLNQQVIAHSAARVLLHAGGVRGGGGIVVLPGQADAGKSTLVAGLVRHGSAYVTDELIGLDRVDGRASGYRKAISLDPGAWPMFPEVTTGSSDHDEERLVDPRRLNRHALDEPPPDDPASEGSPVTLIVFPHVDPSVPTSATALSIGQTLVELIRHTLNPDPLDAAQLDALAEVARRAPAYALTSADLDSAVTLVEGLIEGLVEGLVELD